MVRMDDTSSARPYRGVEAAERLATRRNRLLNAGLDLLGAERQNMAAVTVRYLTPLLCATYPAQLLLEEFADATAGAAAHVSAPAASAVAARRVTRRRSMRGI